MSIQDTLRTVRAKYGPAPSTDECGAICNETAWIHRNDPERWGVSTKNSGSFAILSDGSHIAADIIQNGNTLEAYDVLQATGDGGPANPQWNYIGVLNDPSRPWKAPINPGTEPPSPPNPTPDLGLVLAKLDEILGALDDLGDKLTENFDIIKNALRQDSPVSLSYGIKGTVKGKVIL